MSRVWLRMAGTSEATKYSPSPRPTTTGGPSAPPRSCSGSLPRDHAQREHAGQLLARPSRTAFFQIAVEVFLHQVRDDFGVGFGDEACGPRPTAGA